MISLMVDGDIVREIAHEGDEQPAADLHHSAGVSDGQEQMSRQNRVKPQRHIDGWLGDHGCSDYHVDDKSGDAHDIYVVNLQGEADFAEVFSNPRILPVASKKGLRGLRSYDVGQGWNFLDSSARRKCFEEIQEYKPRCIAVCPPCGPFSTMQACSLSKQDPEERKEN